MPRAPFQRPAVVQATALVSLLFWTAPTPTPFPAAAGAFVNKAQSSSFAKRTTTTSCRLHAHDQPVGNVLILDHLNINHEKGRHDLARAFYFDLLRCAVDPRKGENLDKGRGTLWANIGAQQFHLPEGKPHAQVFCGLVTLAYSDIDPILHRYRNDESIRRALRGTAFDLIEEDYGAAKFGGGGGGDDDDDESLGNSERSLLVTDPWGTRFRLVESADPEGEIDRRGAQRGETPSEGIAMRDLTVYVPTGCDMGGIARFYECILGAPVLRNGSAATTTTTSSSSSKNEEEDRVVVVSVGPRQTLTFAVCPTDQSPGEGASWHDDMVDEEKEGMGRPSYLGNYGPHVSMYVSDLRSTYRRVQDVGATYVNPRFKRRAYTEEEAVDDCMFRCIDIVDPDDEIGSGPILRLEHEIRSVITRDGTKYKSCPFYNIPTGCKV